MGERLCARCCAQVEYIQGVVCQRCGYPQAQNAPATGECDQCRRIPFLGQGLRSLAFHAGPLREAVHALKYRRAWPLSEALAEIMARQWPAGLPVEAVLAPVPLSPERARERGFNQAELLARQLSAHKNLSLATDVLRRVKVTRSQVGLSRSQRLANVSGAFVADPRRTRRLAVIMIDDVCTTGATLGACAEALLQGGAEQVWAYTLARARHDDTHQLN